MKRDEDDIPRQRTRMTGGKFTLEDFRDQMKMIRKMGSLKDLMKMIPGLGGMLASNPDIDAEGDMGRIEAIINSMTPYERNHPNQIDQSRRQRIACGAGSAPSEVDRILIDFHNMGIMTEKMSKPNTAWKSFW